MDNIKILVNPVSGNGIGKKLLTDYAHLAIQATEPHDIYAQVKNFIQAGDSVVIVGGDGTFHLVINGLYQAQLLEQVQVAYYPLGTGNDLGRYLGNKRLPFDRFLAQIKVDCVTQNLPVWRYGQSVFTSYLSFGLDAVILNRVTAWRACLPQRRWVTLLSYFCAGLLGLFTRKKIAVTINKQTESVLSAIFANITRYGGGALIEKTATEKPSLAIVLIHNHWQFIQLMLTRFICKPYPAKMITGVIQISAPAVACEADGEVIDTQADALVFVGYVKIIKT